MFLFLYPCYYFANAAQLGIVIPKLYIFEYYILHFYYSIIYGPTPVQCGKNITEKLRVTAQTLYFSLYTSSNLHREQYQGCLCWPLTVITHVPQFDSTTDLTSLQGRKKQAYPSVGLHKYPLLNINHIFSC